MCVCVCAEYTRVSRGKSIFRSNFGKRSHCGARTVDRAAFCSRTQTHPPTAFETTTKERRENERERERVWVSERASEIYRAQPAARLTSRTYQLKAGWRRQPVWKTQSTAIENRLAGILGRVRGRNSINYELAPCPFDDDDSASSRSRPLRRSLRSVSPFLSLSLRWLALHADHGS